MAQPTPYDRQANFSDFEALNPTSPKPGADLDAEFNAVKITSDQTLANLALIQRDDGALANQSVGYDQLSSALSIGFTLRGAWSAPQNYLRGDGVTYSNAFYGALSSHLSAVGQTPDVRTDLWQKLVDFNLFAPAVLADGQVTTAKLADSALSANVAGRAKMQDGFLSADAAGRAKMADGYLSADTAGRAKMADGYLSADTAGRAKMADDFVSVAKIEDPELKAIAGLTSAANKLPYFTGSGAAALTDLTSLARTILDDTTEDAVRATLGFDFGLAASVGSNALTISLKTAAGNDPSAAEPVVFSFRSATAATGTITRRTLTAATSLVISSGSTMGFTSAVAGRLWIVAFDDAGTGRLGAINCRNGVDIFRLGQFGIASSTAEGGAGAADNAHTFYTGTAVTSKAYAVLGYMEWSSGLTTAGTWAIVPTGIQVIAPGVKLPGDIMQIATASNNVYGSNNANAIPNDNTIPQNSEGSAISTTPSITPSSAANVLLVETNGAVGSSFAGTSVVGVSVCRSDQADAVVAGGEFIYVANGMTTISLKAYQIVGTTSAFTVSNRYGPGTATYSAVINGSTARIYGAAQVFWLSASEIVA
jgi:hypothetical protein